MWNPTSARLLRAAGVALGLLTQSSTAATATPYAGECHRMILLGETENSYLCLDAHYIMPGTYFEWSEKVSLLEIEFATGDTLSATLLRGARHVTDAETGVGRVEEAAGSPLDLGEMLRVRHVGIIQPYSSLGRDTVRIRGEGVDLELDGFLAALVDTAALARHSAKLGPAPRIVCAYEGRHALYFLVGTRPNADGCGESQWIVALPIER